jgi:hypothetical protein
MAEPNLGWGWVDGLAIGLAFHTIRWQWVSQQLHRWLEHPDGGPRTLVYTSMPTAWPNPMAPTSAPTPAYADGPTLTSTAELPWPDGLQGLSRWLLAVGVVLFCCSVCRLSEALWRCRWHLYTSGSPKLFFLAVKFFLYSCVSRGVKLSGLVYSLCPEHQ